jgi:hypothetical protein
MGLQLLDVADDCITNQPSRDKRDHAKSHIYHIFTIVTVSCVASAQ